MDSTLHRIDNESNDLVQNRLLFESLRDDAKRASLYRELRANGFPALMFRSVLRDGFRDTLRWPRQEVYLLSARDDIKRALHKGSVKPYAALDSGGQFMLGQDSPCPHLKQRNHAIQALGLSDANLARCVHEAVARAMVLPQRLGEFDLVVDVAEQAAVRFVSLVFGFPAKAQVLLQQALRATYTRLTFQIIGRHFVPDDGLPPPDSKTAQDGKRELLDEARCAAAGSEFPEWWDKGVITKSVSTRLAAIYGVDSEITKVVVVGLMAGTVGNITSAIANTIDHFFQTDDADGKLIDRATHAARHGDLPALQAMIEAAMKCRPPAPFLARTATRGIKVTGWKDCHFEVPAGSHLLLAMGADEAPDLEWLFGGAFNDARYPHNCIGRRLAWPLIHETVRQVLALPGLARVIDRASDRPKPLVKQWGAICTEFPMCYRRDRRLNQQPLFLMLKIKAPVAENARKLDILTRAGAAVVERALNDAKNVHFAWFGLNEAKTHLTMYTVYDGDFEAYVEHFALKVPLFDEQFKYLEGAPRTPVRLYPKEFVDFIRANNHKPLGGYFYSAYPQLGVADIHNRGLDRP